MNTLKTDDIHVRSFEPLVSPADLCQQIPMTQENGKLVAKHRETIRNILNGSDDRLLVIVGPCSIHDPKAGLEYAQKLARLAKEIEEKIFVVMRVYFEKPRTTVGWKGLINDPHLDGSLDIKHGLSLGRGILKEITELGLPCATEFLDPIVPQYIADLVSWAAIGARTTESQTHREMASGLSMPVGFKNATDGSLEVASNAMISARSPHGFLGIDNAGKTSIVRTSGNRDVHIILRGGSQGTNFDEESINKAKSLLGDQFPPRSVMVDCSHGNSNKDYRKQPEVFQNLIQQYQRGNTAIVGMMLESFLQDGKQSLNQETLEYGRSITDGCISWETTEALLKTAADQL